MDASNKDVIIANLQKQLDDQKQHYTNLARHSKKIETHVKDIEKENTTLEKANKSLKWQVKSRDSLNMQIENNYKVLKENYKDLEATNTMLQNSNERLFHQNLELKTQVNFDSPTQDVRVEITDSSSPSSASDHPTKRRIPYLPEPRLVQGMIYDPITTGYLAGKFQSRGFNIMFHEGKHYVEDYVLQPDIAMWGEGKIREMDHCMLFAEHVRGPLRGMLVQKLEGVQSLVSDGDETYVVWRMRREVDAPERTLIWKGDRGEGQAEAKGKGKGQGEGKGTKGMEDVVVSES